MHYINMELKIYEYILWDILYYPLERLILHKYGIEDIRMYITGYFISFIF